MLTYTIDLSPIAKLTDDQFEQLCMANPEIKFEQTATRELVIRRFPGMIIPIFEERVQRSRALSLQKWDFLFQKSPYVPDGRRNGKRQC